jgi:spermidine/putrescine transport system substrate-binding protein
MAMSRLIIFLVATVLATFSAIAQTGRLNVFIWSEYIDPQVVADFEKKFDCKVVIDLYEDAESMLSKMQGGGASLYDIVVPPDHMVKPMIRLKLLAPLRREKIPNLQNLDPKFANPPFDPGNQYTAGYQWGTVGIFVRDPKRTLPESWSLIFDGSKQPGNLVLMDSMRDTMAAALKYRGHSINSTKVDDVKEARDLILDAKKRSSGFDGSVGAKNKVLGKIAGAAIVYSGEAARGMAEDPETRYIIPKEGSQIWLDNLAIPAEAPHRDLAEKFINYILEPDTGARISNFTQFATPNAKSKPMIKPADLKNPAIYPSEELQKKMEFLEDLGGKTRLYDEAWTQIKSK